MESMLTARQVAELLGVHENWVYDHAASGDLPSYKIGGTRRFDPEELRDWIEQQRENGCEPKPPRRREHVPATGSSRTARREDTVPKPSRRRLSRGGPAGDASAEMQPRLFEA